MGGIEGISHDLTFGVLLFACGNLTFIIDYFLQSVFRSFIVAKKIVQRPVRLVARWAKSAFSPTEAIEGKTRVTISSTS